MSLICTLYIYVIHLCYTFMLYIYVIIYIYIFMHVYIHRTSSIPPFLFSSSGFFVDFLPHEATVRHAKLASTRQSYAFALMKGDGSVVSSSAMARWVNGG